MLRSIRYGEADRILHLYTVHHGRVGAIAKGIRKTTSRVGGRLEPLGHVELLLHQGRGELHTVTGVELIRPHSTVRDDPHRLAVGLIGAVLAALIALGLAGGEPAWAVLPFAALLAWRVLPPFVAAARAPRPALIGAAVRAGVLSLILLDAALATAFAGPLAGAAVLALWPLSLGLARLFAVT